LPSRARRSAGAGPDASLPPVWVPLRRLLTVGVAVGGVFGCANSLTPSPFVVPPASDAGSDAAPSTDAAPPSSADDAGDAGRVAPGEWGGACLDDGQCTDAFPCTRDGCDAERHRCHFVADDTLCDDAVYCDGAERCVPGFGCRPGEPVACSDGTACTIDACVEATHVCTHTPRDADGDGDPDGNCPPGHDCNDADPNVSSKAREICDNGIDDNCDGVVDEARCTAPRYDVCKDPLVVTAPGTFVLSAASAKLDYAATCVSTTSRFRDLVASIVVPAGPSVDVDVVVSSASGSVGLAADTRCGDVATEAACGPGASAPGGGHVARLRSRGAKAGPLPVTLFTDATGSISLTVDFLSPEDAPTNETCGTAATIVPGEHVVAELTSAAVDLHTACGAPFADLVYELVLDQPSDVHVHAVAKDPYGTPLLSFRSAPCNATEGELGCHEADNDSLFRRALSPGHYFVAVGSTGPSDVDVVVETSAPSTAPADETCVAAPPLTPGQTIAVPLADHVDDVQDGCGVGTVDAAYALALGEASDVLLLQGVSDGDQGSVSLVSPACGPSGSLACATSEASLARATARAVPAGDYRVVVESDVGSPATLTAFARPLQPAVLVPFSDACDAVTEVPASGGLFQGNTANASDDFTASCDAGGAGGAPDQLLHLHLDERRRVVLDGKGSAFAVIFDVRSGPTCPGEEVANGCSAGYVRDRSFLDLTLPAGDYYIQVDGYQGASGAWTLDAYLAPP
jgi:hypothetical protein